MERATAGVTCTVAMTVMPRMSATSLVVRLRPCSATRMTPSGYSSHSSKAVSAR